MITIYKRRNNSLPNKFIVLRNNTYSFLNDLTELKDVSFCWKYSGIDAMIAANYDKIRSYATIKGMQSQIDTHFPEYFI